jgi:hypothetical protein
MSAPVAVAFEYDDAIECDLFKRLTPHDCELICTYLHENAPQHERRNFGELVAPYNAPALFDVIANRRLALTLVADAIDCAANKKSVADELRAHNWRRSSSVMSAIQSFTARLFIHSWHRDIVLHLYAVCDTIKVAFLPVALLHDVLVGCQHDWPHMLCYCAIVALLTQSLIMMPRMRAFIADLHATFHDTDASMLRATMTQPAFAKVHNAICWNAAQLCVSIACVLLYAAGACVRQSRGATMRCLQLRRRCSVLCRCWLSNCRAICTRRRFMHSI